MVNWISPCQVGHCIFFFLATLLSPWSLKERSPLPAPRGLFFVHNKSVSNQYFPNCVLRRQVSCESNPVAFWGSGEDRWMGRWAPNPPSAPFCFSCPIHTHLLKYVICKWDVLFKHVWKTTGLVCLLSSLLILKFRDLSLQHFPATWIPFFVLGEVSCQDEF